MKTCVHCHPNCDVCSDSTKKCAACAVGVYRYLGQYCETFCPYPYVANPANLICEYQPEDPTYNLGCMETQYRALATGLCTAIPLANCATYNDVTGLCTSCVLGSYLYAGACTAGSYLTTAIMQLDNTGKVFETCGNAVNYGMLQCDNNSPATAGDGCDQTC